ncbi:MAG TPA: sulfite exporter TauE/SafE family protein [Phycisphaeraceae bacterium]
MPVESLWSLAPLLAIAAIGLVAGTLGGMLGVGGSVIMIPGLTLVFGYNQHLYQAAAMVVNVAVSVPAMLRHRRAGVLVPDVLQWMLPAALVSVLLGVWVSNLPMFRSTAGAYDGSLWLGRMLAAFLVYVIVVNIIRLRDGIRYEPLEQARVTPGRSIGIGLAMGMMSGLLGIGGGAVAVPLQQVILRLPLRQAIANSSAVICISAGVGAIYKNVTLAQHLSPLGQPMSWHDGVLVALLLSPTAWIGGRLGASLTHRLPIRQVRIAFILLMIVSAWKMAAIPWSDLFSK